MQPQPVYAPPPAAHPQPQPQSPRLGEFTGVYQTNTARIRIGRADDNEIILHDLLASRHHAEVRMHPNGRFEIADLGSHNGTYVDGTRLQGRRELVEGSVVAIGQHLLRLKNGRLEEFVDTGSVTFSAYGLTVLAGERVLLDEVSFALEGRRLPGRPRPDRRWQVDPPQSPQRQPACRPRGGPLQRPRHYAGYAELRNRIGYVPQDDILHPPLKVRRRPALRRPAPLPADIPAADRGRRVDEVMAELGLTERADWPVEKLSGGQRKRTASPSSCSPGPRCSDPRRTDIGAGPGL